MIWPSGPLFDQTWPIFELIWDFIETNILTKFHKYQVENVATRGILEFSKIWPSDLVFDPTWPIFKLVQDFIKTNILTMLYDYRTENVASRAYTRQKVENWRRTTDIAQSQ